MNSKIVKAMCSGLVGCLAIILSHLVSPGEVRALDYTVQVSTIDLTSSAANFTAHGAPNIAGGVFIDKIIVSSSDTAAVSSLAVYDTATASHTATLAGRFHLAPSTQGVTGIHVVEFPYNNPWKLTDPAFRLIGTLKKMDITVIYR